MTKPSQGAADTACRVDELVEGLDLGAATRDQVAEAAGRLVALGREGVAHLARSALRLAGPRREKAAALLGCLAGQAARWAAREVEQHLEKRLLNPTEQMWVMALLRRLDEAASGQDADASAPALHDALLDDETELLLWRDEFASLSHEEQQSVLAPILQDGSPALLRLLEVAMSLQIAAVDAAVACGLSRFATPQTLPLLRELLRRSDPVVRRHARASLVALERQGVDVRDVFVATAESDEPVRAALATPPQSDGRIMVLVARGRTPARVRFAAVVVDPVELGIATAWGESGLTEAEFHERVAEYARKMDQRLVRVDVEMAQALVAAGEDYARTRRRPLSPDYLVWRRCIGRPRAAVQLPIVFGPACSRCGARLRGGDLLRGGVVAGRAALCARCAAKPLACAACGKPLNRHTDEVLAREGAEGATLELLCHYCGHGARDARGR
ncbi:MAG TPA: hypothetical protein VNE39_28325 [Planctomycetota bacterium]|nr:hypothetical protein [Planctomycetota bacterium]